jgi:hypothetical protein
MSLTHILGLTGPAQLIRLGSLGPDDQVQHQIAAIFSPLEWDGGRYRRARSGRQLVRLPLPHFIQLPQGTGLVDGVPCMVGGLSTYDNVHVEAGQRVGRLLLRSELQAERLLPPTNMRDFEESEAEVPHCWYYQFKSLDSRFDRVIAPSTAIFTSYYAPTSQLAELILDNDIEALLRSLERNAQVDNHGVSHLHLDRDRHISEVPVIARALFDRTGIARSRTVDIGTRLAVDTRNSQPRCIRATPPFDGQTNLSVYGFVVAQNSCRTLCITQIVSCDHPFPVDALRVVIDQPGERAGQTSKGASASRVRIDEWDFELEVIEGVGKRPGTSHPPVTALGRVGTLFKSLNSGNYSIDRRSVAHNGKGGTWVPINKDPRNSSLKREPSGDADARQTHTSTRQPKNYSDITTSRSLTPNQALRLTLTELDCMSSLYGDDVSSRAISEDTIRYGSWLLNAVSLNGPHRRESWKYLRKDVHRRGILIAQVTRADRHAYVFEILRRGDEAFSTLLISDPDCSALDHATLTGILKRIDEAQMLPKDNVLRAGTDIIIKRVRHNPETSHTQLATIINDRLSV